MPRRAGCTVVCIAVACAFGCGARQDDSVNDAIISDADAERDGEVEAAADAVDGDSGLPEVPIADVLRARSGKRLKVQVYRAEEGVEAFPSFWDSEKKFACQPREDETGQLRCLGREAADHKDLSPFVYSPDDLCTTEALSTPAKCTPPPEVAMYSYAIERYIPMHVTSPLDSFSTYMRGPAGSCAPIVDPPSRDHWNLVRVPPTEYVKLTIARRAIDDTLDAEFYESEDGARVWMSRLYDRTFGTPCSPRRAEDGVMRCLPINGPTLLYTDASCTAKILVDTSAFASGPLAVVLEKTTECYEDSFRVERKGKPLGTIEPLYMRDGASCVRNYVIKGPAFEAAGSVSPASFVAMTPALSPGKRIHAQVWAVGAVSIPRDQSFYDRDLDEPCRVMLDSADQPRCFTTGIYPTDPFYADEYCVTRAMQTGSVACPGPFTHYATETAAFLPPDCFASLPKVRRVHRLGPPKIGPLHRKDATCFEIGLGPHRYQESEGVADESTFANAPLITLP